MAIPQGNIDAAIGLIRQALGPGADGQTLHRALDLLTNEQEPSAPPAQQEGTSFVGNTHQPTTGVDNPDPNAPPFQGTTGGNANAIQAARAADGEAPVNEPERHELGSADVGAANMNLVGGGAGTAGATDANTPAGGDLSAGSTGGAADGSSTFAPQGTTDGSPMPTTQEMDAKMADNLEGMKGEQEAAHQEQVAQQQAAAGGTKPVDQNQLNQAVADGASVAGNQPSTEGQPAKETDEERTIRNKAAREGVLDGNVSEVKEAIAASTSVADLKKLRTEEEAGKTRHGVIDAIDAAIEKLEAE